MDAKIKADWVKALRSGEYQQADSYLRIEGDECNTFCCLGVLCDVIGATWDRGIPVLPNGTVLKQPVDDVEDEDGEKDYDELLSDEALDIVGIPSGEQSTLSEMNDTGKSFGEIADYIEENL